MRSNGRRGNAGNEGRREGRAVLLSSSIRPDPAVARERSRRHLLPSPRDNLLDIYPSSIHPREIAGVILFERSKKTRGRDFGRASIAYACVCASMRSANVCRSGVDDQIGD